MPCLFTTCSYPTEVFRLVISLISVYVYHYVWDSFVFRPFTSHLIKKKVLASTLDDKCRESLWKNVAVLTFFLFGLSIGWNETWFMNRNEYFLNWPTPTSEALKWYYALYGGFWLQGIDFILSLSGVYYKVKRKDNSEMLLHHASTLFLMIFSYSIDFTRVGLCVLMIHDINDLLMETAKFFVYIEWKKTADVIFATFAVVWYALRWYFYTYSFVLGVYYDAHEQLYLKIYNQGGFAGYSPNFWYAVWASFVALMTILLLLHIFWGYLIGQMVVKALVAGSVEKDIRSDSDEDDTTTEVKRSSEKKSVKQRKTTKSSSRTTNNTIKIN